MLKSKDGQPYKLSRPNPLTLDQEFRLEKGKVKLHNFNWEAITVDDTSETIQKHESDFGRLKQITDTWKKMEETKPTIVEEPDIPDVITKEPEPVKQEPVVEVAEESPKFTIPRLKNKVLMHCLPAVLKQKKHDLYDDTFYRLEYGTRFIFEAVLIEGTDFDILFWTLDSDSLIQSKSVVYPFCWVVWDERNKRENRVPFDEYRWWQVTDKEEKDGGWLFTATISSTQPDFSS